MCHEYVGRDLDECLNEALSDQSEDASIITNRVQNGHALANSMITVVFHDSGIANVTVVDMLDHRTDLNEQVGFEVTQTMYDDLQSRINMVLTMMTGSAMTESTLRRIHQGTKEVTTGWLEDLRIVDDVPALTIAVALLTREGDMNDAIVITN